MAKQSKRNGKLLGLFAMILLLVIQACGPPVTGNTSGQLSDNTTKPPLKEITIIPTLIPDKGNPKLDSFLNQLIAAGLRGEAEVFARQRAVQLVDGKVRVEVYAVQGQLDMATKVTAAVGNVEIISRDLNGLQAVVPITSLTDLASQKSIRIIQKPSLAVPQQ